LARRVVRWRAGCDNSKAGAAGNGGSSGKRPPGGGGVRRFGRRGTRTSATARAQRVLPGRRWSLTSAPTTGEKTEARRRSTASPFKTVTMRWSGSGGPGLGWPAATHSRRAGGQATCLSTGQARGRGGIGAPAGGTPAQCRPAVKTGSSLFKRI
jgi:hypothetical protein